MATSTAALYACFPRDAHSRVCRLPIIFLTFELLRHYNRFVEFRCGSPDYAASQYCFDRQNAMTSSFVVDYARTAGKVMYDSYGREPMGGSFSFRPDGTLDELMYGVEITEQGDIFGRHADLKTYLKAAELSGKREPETATFESHHLIPVEVLNQVGISADNGIAVAVDSAGHMNDIHGSAGLASGVVFTDVDQLKNYYRGEYAALGAPEWGDKACEFVDANRDQFASGLAAVAEQLEASKIDPLSEPPPETPTGAADMIEADADNAGDATISDYV